MLALLIPWLAIDPVQQHISGREQFGHGGAADAAMEVRRAIAGVPVTLRAEVAAVDLPVSDILALEVGSVIRLGTPAARGVSLYAENVRVGRGLPGANGPRRAVQVRDVESPQLWDHHPQPEEQTR
jgi:flagellar motor switch protein FliM